MRSPGGSVKRTARRWGRCCWNSPRADAVEPVSEFVTVCSNVARTVFTFAHAAEARSSVASTDWAARAGRGRGRGRGAARAATTSEKRNARHRSHLVPQTRPVARISDHWEMRQLLHERDRREVEEIARHRVEAPDATLAQDDLLIALGEDVLRAQQQIGDGGRHASFEQHRFSQPPRGAQQRVVLHVPRADLDAVGVFGYEMRAFLVQCFGHDGEARLVPRESEQLQTALPHTLERIRRAARLERAAAKRRRPELSHLARGGDDLVLGLHRAGSGDDLDLLTAENHAGGEADEGARLLPLARDLLVGLRDVNDLGDAGQRLDARAVDAPVVADESDRRTLTAWHRPRVIAHLLNHAHHAIDLVLRRMVVHYDQHVTRPRSRCAIRLAPRSLARRSWPRQRLRCPPAPPADRSASARGASVVRAPQGSRTAPGSGAP